MIIFYQVFLGIYSLVVLWVLALSADHVTNPDRPFKLGVSLSPVDRGTSSIVTLRCGQNPRVQTNIATIFRMRIVSKSRAGWDLVAEQRDFAASPEVEGNVTASANITVDTADAFLQVSWQSAANDSFGIFMCSVLGFDIMNNFLMEHSTEIDIHEGHNSTGYFASLSNGTHHTTTDVNNLTEQSKQSLTQERLVTIERSQNVLQTSLTSLESEVSSLQNSLKTVETFLGSLQQWPGGFYALPQPRTGCPVDLAFFGGNHKFHTIHTESQSSSDPSNGRSKAFSHLSTFRADSKEFLTIEMCEVTKQFNAQPWPEGSYCIHQLLHHPCPGGFAHGIVSVDLEDTDPSSYGRNNVASGKTHLHLHFCCQRSLSASVPMRLPTSSPFLLYRLGGACQEVESMRVSEQYLQLNTEDGGVDSNSVAGTHPDVERPGSVTKLYLCYYTQQ